MKLDKYKDLLFQKMKVQISDWFENGSQEKILNEEVYRFLHSINGTAGTLQLGGLQQIAEKLMDNVEGGSERKWTTRELRNFLSELVELSYEYEHFHQAEEKVDQPRVDNVPLIQLIDDDISMLILLKDAMESKGWMVIANTEPFKAIEQYFDMRPDCLIIDINLPNKDGFQLLEDIKEHSNKKFIPKIMISIQNDRLTRINAYKMGADDFIEKPIDLEEFLIRIERHLERKKIFDQSVLIDELTQIYNRKFLHGSLQKSINELKRTNKYFSLAMLDIDFFKKVNDTYGHLAGDRVLVAFAQFLKENIRGTDTVFRYGGEEFIILFSYATDIEAKGILTRLLEEFSRIIFIENDIHFSVTFSAGVFMVQDSSITISQAIKAADQALYFAKNNGRARVESANKMQVSHAKKRLNVSVIDDDAIIRTVLMNILQNMKFDQLELNIQVYEDGLKFFHSNRLDENGEHFLILDGIMPVMDGMEVLQKVKQAQNANDVNVLMLTGRKSEYDIAAALKLGADDYMTKPFSVPELEARIKRLIQRMS
ncbi:diguanylate cyclase [Bacillus sp. FJAT-29790]|uniref:GGDEF domain-containing response regulator n=1 Tax=Bacillus sp. FJAT-29790 TaxID=1895002 RepID=UPI001C2378D4|nr:diguanylate cyclase [Bacillus sp. FJAT-29790]MBU8881041.1 diguanylate cyclase [Bacillus sp. FJAT-29790]